MHLLKLLVILVVGYYVLQWVKLNVLEGYSSLDNDHYMYVDQPTKIEQFLGMGPKESCDVKLVPKGDCCGPERHLSPTTMCGWNNGVSNDMTVEGAYAPESLKGTERVFKYPNYYGYGTANEFGYGEPFYVRTEDY